MEIFIQRDDKGEYISNEIFTIIRFPDNSLKFKLNRSFEDILDKNESVKVRLNTTNSEDFILLLLIDDVFTRSNKKYNLNLGYLMYSQDDKVESYSESYGLRKIIKLLNSLEAVNDIVINFPHSNKSDLIEKYRPSYAEFVFYNNISNYVKTKFGSFENVTWVIPDNGAFKRQYDYLAEREIPFITCSKVRKDGQIITDVPTVNTKTCIIIDDLCIKGGTFIEIAKKLKQQGVDKVIVITYHKIDTPFNPVFFNYIDDYLCHNNMYTNFKITKI